MRSHVVWTGTLALFGAALAAGLGAARAQDPGGLVAPSPSVAEELPVESAPEPEAVQTDVEVAPTETPDPDPYPHPIETREHRRPRLRTGGDVFLRGVTLHDAIAPARAADVLVRAGRIAAIGVDLSVPEGVLVLDGAGRHLAPGVVDAHSHMAISGGVNEGSVSITAEVDMDEVLDADDPALYRALAGGCTTIQVLHGSANTIGGQAALIKLKFDRTEEELVFRGAPKGIKFALGENPKRSNWGNPGERFPASRMGVEALLYRAFERAQEYRAEREHVRAALAAGEDPPPLRRDLRLEALVAVLEGDLVVHAHCYRADEIVMLLRVAEHFGFRIGTLHHVLEGYKVAREIAAHGAATSTFSDWWAFKIEAYDAVPGNAELLDRAGVLSGIKSDSDELVRHLYLEAAKSVGYTGLDRVRALRFVTLHPAMQLGIADRVGSVEVGKDADLVLLDGDPLSVYSKVLLTFVDGEVEFERRDAFGFDGAAARYRAEPLVPEVAAPAEGDGFAIVGATVHPVVRPPMENATLIVRAGRIAALGQDLQVPDGMAVVDGTGKHLFPGLVALDTTLGLREIDSIRATLDSAEDGGNQPDVRVAASLHADSAHLAVTRERGITLAQSAPRGRGPLLGQSAVLDLEGDTFEELLVLDRDMLHLRMPYVANGDGARPGRGRRGEAGGTFEAELEPLLRAFAAAREYQRIGDEAKRHGTRPPPLDPRLAALAPYALGQKTVALHASNAATILSALDLAEEAGLRAVLYGAQEGWKVADAIAKSGVPVVVGPVMSLPMSVYDPYDGPYANAAVLVAAGCQVAVGAGNDDNPRNLGFHAGMAAAFGLDRGAALRAVTHEPARILGLEGQLGALAPGLRADLVLADGDILEATTAVRGMWIAGEEIPLESRQSQLYRRYEARLTEGR